MKVDRVISPSKLIDFPESQCDSGKYRNLASDWLAQTSSTKMKCRLRYTDCRMNILILSLKGQSHEIKVWLFWAEQTEKMLLKSPSGTSFGLYFAFAEYRTDDSNSPAERNVSPAASTDKMKT